jgi:hypothetical protein
MTTEIENTNTVIWGDDNNNSIVTDIDRLVNLSTPPADTSESFHEESRAAIMPVILRNTTMHWSSLNMTMKEALLKTSNVAYFNFFAAVEHAVATIPKQETPKGYAEAVIDDPKDYRIGKYRFNWSTFVYGLKRNGRRDRSIWNNERLLLPFEQLRRTLAKRGVYVVIDYRSESPQALVFNKKQIESSDDFSKIMVDGRARFILGKENDAGSKFYRIVPF